MKLTYKNEDVIIDCWINRCDHACELHNGSLKVLPEEMDGMKWLLKIVIVLYYDRRVRRRDFTASLSVYGCRYTTTYNDQFYCHSEYI